MPDKTRIHTVYKVGEERVPSVTMVLNILAKPALIDWAYNCGVNGIDYRKARDSAGDVGSLIHYMILCDLKGEKSDLSEYAPSQVDLAENGLIKYWDWKKIHSLKTILCETPLVSNGLGYGGTPDWFGELDGGLCLVDYKSGKGIYGEFYVQCGAYAQLLAENGYGDVLQARILRIGRTTDEGYEEKVIPNIGIYFPVFESCLRIYNLRKELKI